ncbi:DUF3551 domain-containing protein [Bradyrhizobium sp.]|uniref:DUF3551 domain-containing protein n=1 Tax=Bradyrhizobium sp. TaxID=376 RepID=UPI002E013012|nr:DUF3551 domain-containing protein [Bradyrhizobium sp.]
MRHILLALAAVCGLTMAATAPAEAVGSRYPFCLQGNDSPGLSNCTFTSYQQCQASASGRFLYCVANPFYAAGGEPDGYRGRRPPPGYYRY